MIDFSEMEKSSKYFGLLKNSTSFWLSMFASSQWYLENLPKSKQTGWAQSRAIALHGFKDLVSSASEFSTVEGFVSCTRLIGEMKTKGIKLPKTQVVALRYALTSAVHEATEDSELRKSVATYNDYFKTHHNAGKELSRMLPSRRSKKGQECFLSISDRVCKKLIDQMGKLPKGGILVTPQSESKFVL